MEYSQLQKKKKRMKYFICSNMYGPAGAANRSVVSDSVRPHGRQPTRLPRPWDSPGKSIGVGCHCLLRCMDLETVILNEASQTEKEKYHKILLICEIKKKKRIQMNSSTKQKQSYRCRK